MHRQIAGRLTGRVTKWVVLVVSLVAMATCAPYFEKLADVQDNDSTSWLPGNAESTRAYELLADFGDPEAITTAVVYEKPAGFDEADVTALQEQATQIATIKGVIGQVDPPRLSDDRQAAVIEVTVSYGGDTFLEMPKAADRIREIAESGPQDDVYVAGFGGLVADQAEVFSGSDVNLLLITLGIVILILLVTYRSPIMWVLPIFSSMVALAVSNAVVYFLAKEAGLTVNGQSAFILTVLVVGAGTDYALLLVARYREELRRHADRHEAMAVALHRAAPAIIASAATVALGLLCLTLAEMNSTAGLGPVLAVGVVVTLLVMVTTLPALLVIFGRWIFWPKRPLEGSHEPTTTGVWARVGSAIAPRPRLVWVGTAGLLLVACLGLFTLDNRGLSGEESFVGSDEVESLVGDQVAVDHGLSDNSNPLLVVARADQAEAVTAAVGAVDGVTGVAPAGEADGRVLLAASINGDPYAQAAFDIVKKVRTAVDDVPGDEVLVGGNSAVGLDIADASARDNFVVTPVVLLVVLLVLMVLLRSLAAPLLLIGTVVLSFGAALGLSSLIFTQVLGYEATDAAFPLFAFVFLVALGIDYNIFLMTRVREESAKHGTRKGSLIALSATGGVITSAGLVLAATFAALGTLPLVFALQIGIAVALGVLLDTMIVRSILVTALNLDLGAKIWWPSRLDPDDRPLTRDDLDRALDEPSGEGRPTPQSAGV
ncbi:MMPL family transporter [Nocardioides rubriscoriae]|uniref:MMPL family transporter n=1 Tax=Nocardioides rubriscoriae TaxID=642762 RepID=UPI0011DF04A3|nr:MMPL family transporter [Nocardioides rubriscoriae]